MVQFVNDCIYRCSDRRKLLHLDVPPTVKYFHFNALPKLVLELFILASQKGRPGGQTGQYQCSFTNSCKLSRRYSPGETPPHTAWVHFSHLEHSMAKWLFLTAFPHTTHGYLPPTGPGLTFTSPARNNTKLTHRPLQKSRLTDLCCCLTPRYPQQTVGNSAFWVRLVFSAMFTTSLLLWYRWFIRRNNNESSFCSMRHVVTSLHLSVRDEISHSCVQVRFGGGFRWWLKRRTATAVQIKFEGKVHHCNERDAFAWRPCLWQA